MAQKNVTILIDDLTGKQLSDGTGETVYFALDGDDYVIDVDSRGAERLRSLLATYVAAGRRVKGQRSGATRWMKIAPDPSAVRAWAAANGIAVNDRGRIPATVLSQFEAAGN